MQNIFEIGAQFQEGWSSDNKNKPHQDISHTIKAPNKHQLYFAKEKHRGKVVTLVKPFYLDKKELQNLLRTLKKKLGIGGTLKENTLMFQGEIPEQLRKHLLDMGYRFKN